MSRVVVVGSTMIEQLTYAQKLPGPGETLVGTRCAMGYGGKGANQAVMARNLGGNGSVAMVNCLGDPSVDHYAKLYKSRFEELGINVDHIHFSEKGTMTGIAPVWVEASGQNRTRRARRQRRAHAGTGGHGGDRAVRAGRRRPV